MVSYYDHLYDAHDMIDFCPDVEHTSVPERNGGLLPEHLACYAQSYAANIKEMIETMIEPLKCEPGIEAFHKNIVEVEFRLYAGLLRNPREVEAMLKSSGRVSTTTIHKLFTSTDLH